MGGHPNTPKERVDLYHRCIMQVGQSLVTKKIQLMAEILARAPEEDLEKLQEAVKKDSHGLERCRTLPTHTTLPMDYKCTLMEVRQCVNVLEELLVLSKKLLKGMKMHPDRHTEKAMTGIEGQVQILGDDRMELRGYLGLMEEEILMPWVARLCKSPEKLLEAPAAKGHTDSLPTAVIPTVEFYKMQLELTYKAAEKATEVRKAFKSVSDDIWGPAQIGKARALWYHSWVTLVNLLDCRKGSPEFGRSPTRTAGHWGPVVLCPMISGKCKD